MNITIDNLDNWLKIGVSIVSSIIFFYKLFQRLLRKELAPFNDRIDETINNNNKQFGEMRKLYQELQLQTDKNYLVRFLADVERGEKLDETEKEHFHFTYKNYHDNNGNSYIDHKVDKLMKEGKL